MILFFYFVGPGNPSLPKVGAMMGVSGRLVALVSQRAQQHSCVWAAALGAAWLTALIVPGEGLGGRGPVHGLLTAG